MIWIQVGILVATIIIGLVTYLTAYRHRVIYAIDTDVIRMPHGGLSDRSALETEHINKKLKSGEYTILQIVQRYTRDDKGNNVIEDLEIIYGQVKKPKKT